jgi:uncharacterized protein (TIGR02246 family)
MNVEAKLRELSDRAEIGDLVVRYALAQEDRDAQACAKTFTPDGVMDFSPMGSGRHEGRRAIADHVAEMFEKVVATAHITTNHLITDIAANDASGTAYVFSRATHTNGMMVDWLGRYADRYRRIDEGWRIAERRVVAMLPGQILPHHEKVDLQIDRPS